MVLCFNARKWDIVISVNSPTVTRPQQKAVPVRVAEGDIAALCDSFRRALVALHRSPYTIRVYTISVAQFASFLAERGMPLLVANITAEHVREWLSGILAHQAPATARTRHRGVYQFFAWLVAEGELKTNPMTKVPPPSVPEAPPPLLDDKQIAALLKACSGSDFESRRDLAILRVLLDSGARRSEIAYLELDDVDLDGGRLKVLGKGSRVRSVSVGGKTIAAIDRYLRIRGRHKDARSTALWLGRQGPLQDGALDLMLRRRARQAGLDGEVHAHLFRHGFAHNWLSAGGQERDLMSLAGWRSPEQLKRYGASAAAERAHAAHQRLAIGDRY